MPSKSIWITGVLVVSLLLAGARWAWITFVADDQLPQFETISVEPVTLRFTGGPVMVQAQVTDDNGVQQVGGVVLQGGTELFQLPVKSLSEKHREFTYLTEFQAPSNLRSNGGLADYSIRLVAVDSAGQETVGEAAFQVAAPAPPPAPPQ